MGRAKVAKDIVTEPTLAAISVLTEEQKKNINRPKPVGPTRGAGRDGYNPRKRIKNRWKKNDHRGLPLRQWAKENAKDDDVSKWIQHKGM